MNTKVKAKWLKALRSGEYEQGTGVLVNEKDRFCCLGVLCNISGRGEWEKRPEHEDWYYKINDQDYRYGGLPRGIAKWSEVQSYQELSLVGMNDGGHSFGEIADYIEENL